MSKIGGGRQFNPQAFQQARSEGPNKGKSSSSSSGSTGTSNTGSTGSSSKSSSKPSAGSLDDLPNVGLDQLGNAGGVDIVDAWQGGSGAAYANDAAEQHNQIGTKAARGELLSQQGANSNPQNQALKRQVDTLKARLQKLENQISGTEQAGPTQSTQRVGAAAARQVGRSFGATTSNRQAPVQAENVAAVGNKQTGLLDDDLPRVGLK